jgi:hypothetical protein
LREAQGSQRTQKIHTKAAKERKKNSPATFFSKKMHFSLIFLWTSDRESAHHPIVETKNKRLVIAFGWNKQARKNAQGECPDGKKESHEESCKKSD